MRHQSCTNSLHKSPIMSALTVLTNYYSFWFLDSQTPRKYHSSPEQNVLSSAYSYSNSLPKDIMTPKELEISRNLMMAKSDAQKYGLQENIDRFKQRVKESQMGRRDL